MPNNEYFQSNPTRLDVSRSRMTMHPRWTGSWNTGKLVPIFATSGIMPGDTVRMDISAAIRSITPVFPVMDDADITVEAFFVPHRLVLSRKSMSPDVNDSNHSWAAFLGAQDSLLNMPTPGDVQLPYMNVSSADYVVGGLADCLGFAPPQVAAGVTQEYKVNGLKPLAYYSIWNEFFRDCNTRSPVTYSITSGKLAFTGSDAGSTVSGTEISDYELAPVSRYHGYFGSALPWPQRNTEQVQLPLGELAPVITDADHLPTGTFADPILLKVINKGSNNKVQNFGTTDSYLGVYGGSAAVNQGVSNDVPAGDPPFSYNYGWAPANLWTDLSTATAATINQLREKVQEQRWYEALARGGNKLEDLNYSMFGVRGPSVATRPEYLGGVRIPISISQVASTSDSGSAAAAGSTGKVGGTGAFSLTNLNNYLFTKSFTEHGTLMVVACVRVHDSFGQGVSREDTKFDRFQFYWPQYANLGEQKIARREIFVNGSSDDDAVFGYQEAWAEYRMFPDQVTGHVRPGEDLDMITYANNFASAPTLKSFLDASSQKDNVDRTLQVTSASAGFQWYGQFQFNMTMTRPMPLYSIPGLIDHH